MKKVDYKNRKSFSKTNADIRVKCVIDFFSFSDDWLNGFIEV